MHVSRHCEEPTGRANARPMTGSATKQSRVPPTTLDCFASLAMTVKYDSAISRLEIGDAASCLRLFKSNRDAGLLLFAGLLVDAVMRAGS